MTSVLTRAGSFVAIIFMGYLLRRKGFFKEEDFKVLSKILVKITLPGVIVASFVGQQLNPKLLTISLISLGGGIIYIALAYFLNRKKSREEQAFAVINSSGYNVGAFTMPFAQGFLGSLGVITASLFDIGNACICFGGSLGMGQMLKEGKGFSVKKLIKTLLSSVAFDCYLIMVIMSLLKISIPLPVASFAGIIGDANAFVAMLMVGIGFKIGRDKEQFKCVARIMGLRYAVSTVIAIACYLFLPFSREIRVALVILAFSPIPAAATAYTEQIKGNVGLASAVNSTAILCSLVLNVILCIVLL